MSVVPTESNSKPWPVGTETDDRSDHWSRLDRPDG